MRLAVVLPGLSPTIGGGFTFVEEVARALERVTPPQGLELLVLSDGGDASGAIPRIAVPREGAIGRSRRRLARGSQRLSRMLGAESPVERAARAAGASIVWFPTGGSEAIDLPFVATVWDIQHRTHPWFPEVSSHGLWRAREESSRELLSRAALVVCGTNAGAAELEAYYQVPRHRVVVAPHPTPGWALAEHANGAIGAGPGGGTVPAPVDADRPDEPIFVYPAQFWPHKNHAMLLRALAQRRRAGSRATLVLVGGDLGIRARVQALASELGVASCVHFPGFIPREALCELYRRATALVYPAFSGPENLPPLEAFALGCPVANAEFPGAREQLGDAALSFDPMDAGSIAACMERLEVDAELRARLSAAGRRIAAERRGEAFVDTVLKAIAALRPMIDPFT